MSNTGYFLLNLPFHVGSSDTQFHARFTDHFPLDLHTPLAVTGHTKNVEFCA
jgi:hypothetical protein